MGTSQTEIPQHAAETEMSWLATVYALRTKHKPILIPPVKQVDTIRQFLHKIVSNA